MGIGIFLVGHRGVTRTEIDCLQGDVHQIDTPETSQGVEAADVLTQCTQKLQLVFLLLFARKSTSQIP